MINFRNEYRVLSEAEKAHVLAIKHAAENLDAQLWSGVNLAPEGRRLLAIARTHLEAAVMYAVKAWTL